MHRIGSECFVASFLGCAIRACSGACLLVGSLLGDFELLVEAFSAYLIALLKGAMCPCGPRVAYVCARLSASVDCLQMCEGGVVGRTAPNLA